MNNLNNTPGTGIGAGSSVPNLKITSQNVRSFNLSVLSENTDTKIHAVVRSKGDIILLSDTRLNSEKNTVPVNSITKKLRFLGYNFLHNSITANRGVGILISKKLNYNILDRAEDDLGNFLLIKIKIDNTTLIIGSIYGPNINDNSNIYDELDIELNRLNTEKIILGGDWNCTVDCRNVDLNIDVLNMAGIPSKLRSEKVKNVFSKYKLTDPYRYFYPNKRDFTYIPGNLDATNRSRLDVFGVMETLVTKIGSCCISNA